MTNCSIKSGRYEESYGNGALAISVFHIILTERDFSPRDATCQGISADTCI